MPKTKINPTYSPRSRRPRPRKKDEKATRTVTAGDRARAQAFGPNVIAKAVGKTEFKGESYKDDNGDIRFRREASGKPKRNPMRNTAPKKPKTPSRGSSAYSTGTKVKPKPTVKPKTKAAIPLSKKSQKTQARASAGRTAKGQSSKKAVAKAYAKVAKRGKTGSTGLKAARRIVRERKARKS